MARFLNEYTCYRCEYEWSDEWSSIVDDDCPKCGARHCSPDESTEMDEDQSFKVAVISSDGKKFAEFVIEDIDYEGAEGEGLLYIESHGLGNLGMTVQVKQYEG